ncbi:MAG: carboxypeptidase-like regulatory domain-containing protein [Acidobacteriota bacterium]|jgi:hypothetical protein|nr:carboxypeptidase-like regulatory domain-containing protein [Bryobacteraceae bacterium CoA2 C42]
MIAIQPSFSASPVSNEDDTASIAVIGSVVDVLKLPIARTTVTLTIPGTDQVAKEVWADENGNFIIKVPAKRYVIRLVTPGFRARATRLENPTAGATLDIGMVVLQIGEITEGPLFPAKASGTQLRRQISPITPATVGDIASNPERFNGKMFRIQGRVGIAVQDFELLLSDCDRTTIDGIWLEYGRGAERQPIPWCCGDGIPRDPLTVLDNADFRKSHRYLTARRKTDDCDEAACYWYDVTATLSGRFDFALTEHAATTRAFAVVQDAGISECSAVGS